MTEVTGSIGSTSFYRIKVPANWNGTLVIWNHGYSLSPLEEVPGLGPLEPVQLAQGYAIAASSYRQIGWSTFRTDQDLKKVYDVFKRTFGEPKAVVVTGGRWGASSPSRRSSRRTSAT